VYNIVCRRPSIVRPTRLFDLLPSRKAPTFARSSLRSDLCRPFCRVLIARLSIIKTVPVFRGQSHLPMFVHASICLPPLGRGRSTRQRLMGLGRSSFYPAARDRPLAGANDQRRRGQSVRGRAPVLYNRRILFTNARPSKLCRGGRRRPKLRFAAGSPGAVATSSGCPTCAAVADDGCRAASFFAKSACHRSTAYGRGRQTTNSVRGGKNESMYVLSGSRYAASGRRVVR
jgi:hypothetical protein